MPALHVYITYLKLGDVISILIKRILHTCPPHFIATKYRFAWYIGTPVPDILARAAIFSGSNWHAWTETFRRYILARSPISNSGTMDLHRNSINSPLFWTMYFGRYCTLSQTTTRNARHLHVDILKQTVRVISHTVEYWRRGSDPAIRGYT